MDHQARRRSAALARSAERTPDRAFDCQIYVRVVHHNDHILAAHLKRADRVTFGAGSSDDASRLGGTGERNQA
jgi:hypothetical protein